MEEVVDDPYHRMPVCCEAMRRAMRPADKVVGEPPSGFGASLVIRYGVAQNDSG